MTKKTASKKTAAKTKASLKNKPSGKKAKPAARVQAVSKKTAVAPKKAPKKILKPEKKPVKAVGKAVSKPAKKTAPKAAKSTNEPKRKFAAKSPAKKPANAKSAPEKRAKKPTAQKKSVPAKKNVKQEKKISPKKVQPAPQKTKAEKSRKVQPEAKKPAKKAEPSKSAPEKSRKAEPEKPAKTKAEKPAAAKPLAGERVSKDVKGKKKHERPSHNIYFSMDDLAAYFEHKETAVSHHSKEVSEKSSGVASKAAKASAAVQVSKKPLAVATVFDILGLNPVVADTHEKLEESDVPRKWRKYFKLLVDLRRHHSSGVEMRSEEVLKRSAKEDAGDLSSYGQHLADAGSESFERDMAYNLISNQKEILAEIDEAIKRIKNGTYGICEVTGKPIPESRLTSIPYTRCTKEGQEIKETEARKQKSAQRGAAVYDMPSEQGGGEEDASA